MSALSNHDLFGSDTDSDMTVEPEKQSSKNEIPKITSSPDKKTSLIKRRSTVHEISDSDEGSEEFFLLKGKAKNSGIIKKKLESPKKDVKTNVSENKCGSLASKFSRKYSDVKNWLDSVDPGGSDELSSNTNNNTNSKLTKHVTGTLKTEKPNTLKSPSCKAESPHGLKRKQTEMIDEEKLNLYKKPVCQYGSKCYRKNPSHFEEFSHPKGLNFIFFCLLL